MTQDEINQTIRKVKERQRRGKQIRAKEAAEKANASALRPEVVQAIRELNKSQPKDESDYERLILAFQKKNDCSYLEATRAMERLVPNISEIKEKWIQEKNAEREAANTPRSVATVDGKNFPEMVSYLRLHHKMSVPEAHRHIDQHYPGLRQTWIDKKNS